MDKNDAYLWLKNISGISTKTIDKLENEIVDIENLIEMSDKEIYNLRNVNLNVKENIIKHKNYAHLDDIKNRLYKKSIKYVCINDKNYPKNLRKIYNAPKLLYYRGDISLASNSLIIAMVGSRKCSSYGKNCAITLSKNLSNQGINIVSGLAIGVDSYSHEGCMMGNAKTIAVLGSSVDNPLPKQNIKLSEKILEQDGLIVSEYNIDSVVLPSNFSNRNRIISGISDGVVVVEAANKSGALITVDFALEQGKNVFAVPGNITSEMSRGCNRIIKEGATLTDSIDDILTDYNIISINSSEVGKSYDNINLSDESKVVIDTITKYGNLHIDKICDHTNIDIKKLTSILIDLELKDLIVNMNNRIFLK